MTARVSLALPVHNGAKYLEEALRSLVGQTYSDFELNITDNASTDATQEICESFALGDKRIAYCRLPKNIGAGPNFNLAFGSAHGKFFKWCAHDDLISPNFVERCVATLESRSDAALAYGRTQCIDEKGAFIDWTESGFMPSIEFLIVVSNDSAWRSPPPAPASPSLASSGRRCCGVRPCTGRTMAPIAP